MLLGEVSGTVVAAKNADRIESGRYLIVSQTDASGSSVNSGDDPLVALDLVGAERGQVVIVSQGSSARNTFETKNGAIDAVIIGIVDAVDEAGTDGGYRAR